MSDRDQAFRAERAKRVKVRTRLQRDAHAEIVRLLETAAARVRETLAGQPSDYQRWTLPRLQAEIERVMADFSVGAASTMAEATGAAWQAGTALVEAPIEAGGVRLTGLLPALDTQQLLAMRAFATDRIKDIAAKAANAINTELGLVVMGAQTPGEAVGHITKTLGEPSRARAVTIVRTELGRAFAVAAQKRAEQAAAIVPGLKKQWRRSGKMHPRPDHVLADGQIRELDKPFAVGGLTLMHPHDPKAPAKAVINCGCVALPYMADWTVRTPGAVEPQPTLRDIQAGRAI